MTDEERFQVWLTKVCARELPQNPMVRIRTLAKELAEGAADSIWATLIWANVRVALVDGLTEEQKAVETKKQIEKRAPGFLELQKYLYKRWNQNYPGFTLLCVNGYLAVPPELEHDTQQSKIHPEFSYYHITEKAFHLINEVEPANIFISYKRSESSALALLILKSLKIEGLEAFLDLALEAGENWHAGLKERIQQYDYFVLLLGKETLKSEVVLKEIQWALEAGLSIIPVWHNGFKYQSDQWQLPPDIDHKLSNTHAIEVKEESALGYDTAITELLNRFGVTP